MEDEVLEVKSNEKNVEIKFQPVNLSSENCSPVGIIFSDYTLNYYISNGDLY